MVDIDNAGTAECMRKKVMYVAIADHFVMFIMQFLTHAWPWSNARMEGVAGYDPRMSEGWRGIVYQLLTDTLEKIWRVGF